MPVVQCFVKVVSYILSVFPFFYSKKAISVQKKQKSSRGKTFRGKTQKLPILILLTFDYQNSVIQQHLVIRRADK